MGVKTLSIAALPVALLLLTGCPAQPVDSPAGHEPQAFAPALTNVSTASPPAAPQANAKATAPAQPAPPPIHQQLIDQVEGAYSSGVANYRAGRLAAAKADFDHAVDLMLTSGIDIKNDSQLNDEFERIVDGVNALEMEALKQGNGFAPKVEPAPVDIANDVTFPADPTVTAKAVAELKTTVSDLPLVINEPVASQINFFSSTKGHGTLMRSLQRAGRYKQMIQKILADEGLPQDLIYQAVAESGFQPQAVNGRSGAGGMWQFMPFTSYGIVRNGYYDDRFDPEKSTRAYARYMKELYNQFGDWYLAMAAYDWGAGGVQRAVQRTGYADFWELYRRNALPQETKNYVPIILAATIMAKNPAQYGLDTMVPDPPLIVDTVTTNYAVDLRLVADVVEAPVQEVIGLNPSLLRMSTPADMSFDLHLPPGTNALFQKRIAEIPEDKRRYWRYHKLTPGETLAEVARQYHVGASELSFVNQLTIDTDLSAAEALIIPLAPASASAGLHTTSYTVKHGDTLVTIADRFNVSVDQLRHWNNLHTSKVDPGRKLNVAEPAHITRVPHSHSSSKSSSKSTKGTNKGTSKGTTHKTTPKGNTSSSKTRSSKSSSTHSASKTPPSKSTHPSTQTKKHS